ncbi:TolC family protein [Helicobacter sp. faydin-H20]|uniref:TolC family protein n=1 Tax=Helicobacter anatolicus TaxID=2905874 RepID=UPI001E602C84|nr:TolC family protein [Helicobacter anatolicus]MCE3036889.1 TolC family protein [Helicobacter anatolicus]
MKKIIILIVHLQLLAFAYELDYEQFINRVEKNSINLIKSKAQMDSGLQDYRASMAWKTSYIESEIAMGKTTEFNIESTTILMITPRLPWVSAMLNESLQTKTLQYKKTYDLMKQIAIIGAKRVYFSYILAHEKHQIYKQREQNFLSQLQIAKAKFEAGSVSKKDYVNFKNSYYEAKLARIQIEKELFDLESSLLKLLGLSQREEKEVAFKVLGLEFGYLGVRVSELEELIKNSPYLEIIALSAKDHGINAKASSYERWDSFEIGAGLQNTTIGNHSENLASIRLQIPIPITRKYDFLKKKYLVLQSASLREGEVTKNNIQVQAKSYYKQLQTKKEYIELQKESIQNKKALVDMSKTAYEAQKVSLFEYLAYQNAYMDSLITLINAKMDYIQTQTLLEETLGVVLQKGKK